MSVFHTLHINRVQQEANQTLHVSLDVPAELEPQFKFLPGQYLTFAAHINNTEVRRSYSICAAPHEPLSVAIKKIPGGVFSEYAHTHFQVGTPVSVQPPTGSFCTPLSATQQKNYLLIAAGSGITPILSIAKAVLAEEPASQVTLLYGNRRSADIIFREQLCWLKNRHMSRFQWLNIFSQETQAAPILNGRINNQKGSELNQRLINITSFDEFFLCGPEGMVSEVTRGLRASGINEANIHHELFFASAEDAQAALARHTARARQYAGLSTSVRIRAGGREVAFALNADGQNILDSAIDNGLDLPFACKSGVCATCKARLLEGAVDMDLHHALTAEELEQGFILTCQAHPISAEVLINFD